MKWPGKWHSKVEREPGLTNDHGTLYMVGDDGEEWLSYDPDGHDPHTEVRR